MYSGMGMLRTWTINVKRRQRKKCTVEFQALATVGGREWDGRLSWSLVEGCLVRLHEMGNFYVYYNQKLR